LIAAAVVFVISLLVVYAAYSEHQAKLAKRAELAALDLQRREQRERTADAVYFAVAEGTRAIAAGHAYGWCAASTYLALGPFGALISGILCSALVYEATDGTTEAVHAELFDRPYHPDAAAVGRVVGVIGGALLLAPGDYAGYEAEARALTEETYRANRALIDPAGLRGADYHLHHIVPLRCGFSLGIPASIMAGSGNLEVITAEANQRIGAMGCSG
jgi:hypothetical protein